MQSNKAVTYFDSDVYKNCVPVRLRKTLAS
jgi:hypothetical protein